MQVWFHLSHLQMSTLTHPRTTAGTDTPSAQPSQQETVMWSQWRTHNLPWWTKLADTKALKVNTEEQGNRILLTDPQSLAIQTGAHSSCQQWNHSDSTLNWHVPLHTWPTRGHAQIPFNLVFFLPSSHPPPRSPSTANSFLLLPTLPHPLAPFIHYLGWTSDSLGGNESCHQVQEQ